MQHERDKVEDIVIVSQKSENYLNQRQLAEYRDFRRKLIKWMRHVGKDPEKATGYAHATARQRAYKFDRFYR